MKQLLLLLPLHHYLKKLLLLTLLGTAFAAQAEAAAPSTYRDIARLRAMNQRAQGIRPAADGKSYTTLRGNAIERHSYTKDAPGELLFEWKNDKENRDIADYQFHPTENCCCSRSAPNRSTGTPIPPITT